MIHRQLHHGDRARQIGQAEAARVFPFVAVLVAALKRHAPERPVALLGLVHNTEAETAPMRNVFSGWAINVTYFGNQSEGR